MDIDIVIKNYRCFPLSHPIRLQLRNGFTAFVGVNNSGKSSLLRFFYEFRFLFRLLSDLESFGSPSFLQAMQGGTSFFGFPPSILDPNEVFCDANNSDLEITFHFIEPTKSSGNEGLSLLKQLSITLSRDTLMWQARVAVDNWGTLGGGSPNIGMSGTRLYENPTGTNITDLTPIKNLGQLLRNILYIGPFRNVINLGATQDYFDIAAGQAFVSNWRNWKSGGQKESARVIQRLTDDVARIFGYTSLEINPSANDQTLQIIVNRKSYMLSELGSGLAQFILVLANAATRKPSFILIDEPEQNLHPSLQVDFLTTLSSYASNGTIFTTHSIGLARTVGNRIYSLQRSPVGLSQINVYEKTSRLSEFLGELSYSSYQELGFEQILLVEGPTEVATIQQFLRLYGKDHRIVVVPMGGEQLIHKDAGPQLEEIKRITPNISALIDSERSAEGEDISARRKAFVEVCRKAGIKCHFLKRRAIENYLSDRAVKLVKGPNHNALGPYEKLNRKENEEHWGKSENWRIALEMTKDELDQTDLGVFLQALG